MEKQHKPNNCIILFDRGKNVDSTIINYIVSDSFLATEILFSLSDWHLHLNLLYYFVYKQFFFKYDIRRIPEFFCVSGL